MYISTNVKLITGKIPVALSYLLATTALAQNTEEIRAMQKKTDVIGLNSLSKIAKKGTLSLPELRSSAKKRNLTFEGHTNGRFFQLQGFTPKTGLPIYYITYNNGAGAGTKTHPLHNLGGGRSLEGKGLTLHEWDAGAVRESHQEFGGRVIQMDGANRLDEHATHVGGTMVAAGVQDRAKGMAPKAMLHAYDWRNDTDEMIEAAKTALVSNHSYGVPGGFQMGPYSGTTGWHWFTSDDETEDKRYGKYGHTDALWDFISLKAPYYLPVKAAGNDRGNGPEPGGFHFVHNGTSWESSTKVRQKSGGEHGYDCISSGNLPKNSLIVGAARKIRGEYTQPSDVDLVDFSSTGPTDDGRIKPDILGIGVDIYSTSSAGNTLYSTLSGTSMASPNVAGSLGLLQEHYKRLYGTNEAPFMKSATLKALAIHTAYEAGAHDGPDYQHGWGLLNATKAVQVLSEKDKYSIIQETKLNQNDTHTLEITAKGNEPVVVTITWDDAAPENVNTPILNDRTPTLVNDLDIRISDGTTTFFPWVLNPDAPADAATKGDNYRDNVEQIVIPNPTPGQKYTISVSHKAGKQLKTNAVVSDRIILADATHQDFSLIATGITQGIDKDLELTAIHIPNAKEFSNATPIQFVISNVAEESVSNAKVAYKLINKDDNDRVEAQGSINLNEIAKGENTTQTIDLDLSKSFTNYIIEAQIISNDDKIKSNDILSVDAYGILSNLTIDNAQHHFGFEDDLHKNGWTIEDTDESGITWKRHINENTAKTGKSVIFNNSEMAQGVNDWLFTNPLKLKENQAYKIILNVKKNRQDIADSIDIFIGNEPKSTAMTQIGNKIDTTTEYVRYAVDYTPTADGVYYIGFNNKTAPTTPAYGVMIDDVSIVQAFGRPMVDFKTSTKTPNSYEAVALTSDIVDTGLPTLSYEWKITPETFTFVENTDKNTENPKVIFNKEGVYTISLKATNAKGESTEVKKDFIKVENTNIVANYNGGGLFYQGNVVKFTDASKGNPMPNRWKWSVTPSDEVQFVNGTNENSQNPEIKFNKVGKYAVKLEAEFVSNGTSISKNSTKKNDVVEVKQVYIPVENLNGNLNNANGEVQLTWERPTILPLYTEDFESNGSNMPQDFLLIDEDADKDRDGNTRGWTIDNRVGTSHAGNFSAYSESFFSGKFRNVSNWMITGKVKAGAEILKFWKKSAYKERLDIYLIPATGGIPTLEQIKTGQLIHSSSEATGRNYKEVKIDISAHTNTEHYIAFHHKTRQTDRGKDLYIDDIVISYKTEAERSHAPREVRPFGAIDAARLVGYEVYRDNHLIKNINDINQLSHNDIIPQSGTYTYDVYAVYSDGLKSEKKSITIQTSNLSTSEVKDTKLKIYPNPSNGRFTIEAESGISKLKTEVYDMSGKLIFKDEFKGNTADLNLTQYPKGVYILNLVDSNGNKQSAKLIIK